MKKYVVIALFMSSTLFGAFTGWKSDYNAGLLQAQKENKILYLLITSDSCPWCDKFVETTLQNKGLIEKLKHRYVTIQLSKEWDDIPKKFKTSPIPRHYFVSPKGEILYSSLGHRDVEMFEEFMRIAEEKLVKGKK